MRLNPKWVAAALGAIALTTCITTGLSLVPPSLVIGPCLKDWTSAVSYRHRVSPLATVDLRAGGTRLRLCYGRPAMHGRTVFGGLVPYDSLWRLGANEPTRLSLSAPVSLAGISLPAGRYSLYVIPHPGQWELFVSRSTLHWGNDISPAVRAQEVGRAALPVESLASPVETLTVRADPARGSASFRVEWEHTGITLPVTPAH
jgi:hypothetical protein